MKIEPLALAEFDLVEVKTTNGCGPTPHCKKHGAMNKITSDGIWRCITVSGYKLVKDGNSWGKQHAETICRAGCSETLESQLEAIARAQIEIDHKNDLEVEARRINNTIDGEHYRE